MIVGGVRGIVNVGGSAEHFSTSDPANVATWQEDLSGDGEFSAVT